MRLSCFLFTMLPILLLGVILSEAKNLEDIRMGKEFSKNMVLTKFRCKIYIFM